MAYSNNKRNKRESVSSVVRKLIGSNPALRRCIELGVVSTTKTAEFLKPAVEAYFRSSVSLPAIKVAVSRFVEELESARRSDKQLLDIVHVISRSSIELKTDISIVITRITAMDKVYHMLPVVYKSARFLAVMHSTTAVTIVADSNSIDLFKQQIQSDEIIAEQRDLSAVIIISPEEIMYTPGVISYITSLLSNEGVNIIHIESSYRDTILVVAKEDAPRTFNMLTKLVEAVRTIDKHSELKQLRAE